MRAPLKLNRLTPRQREQTREIKRAFHVRAFGEELARVNLDMTEAERIKYIGWMRRLAAQHGVKPGVSAEYEWMKRVEDEIEAEEGRTKK
jgi:hypothetical protein